MLESVFKQLTRDEWCDIMQGTDVCFAPVLDHNEAANHPHNQARGTYVTVDGLQQPAPAPRFSEYSVDLPTAPRPEGSDTEVVLSAIGFSNEQIAALTESGAIPSAS